MATRFGDRGTALMMPVVLMVVLQCIQATPQRTAAYSLQAAVDELHRREAAKYPLNAPPPPALDDWDEDGDLFGKNRNRNRHRLNKALGKYLERDEDSYGPDHNLGLGLGLGMGMGLGYQDGENSANNLLLADEKRKRFSSFRERDEQYDGPVPSVFRERENQPLNAEPTHNELTDQFLREIEEARERDAVRQWWRHLDQAKNQQEQDGQEPQDTELYEQKKRMRVPPYYLLMQKKRSYPVLPWLPYNGDKRKRFPVAKRSTSGSNPESPLGQTDERVAQELSELFGKPGGESRPHPEEKRKRSADDQTKSALTTNQPETPAATATATGLGDMRLEINFQRVNVTSVGAKEASTAAPPGEMVQHGGHAGHHGGHVPGMSPEYRHRKRSDHDHDHAHAHGENADETETDEHDEEGEESSDEDDHDEFDEEEGDQEAEDAEERRRKKKRAAATGTGIGEAGTKHLHAPTVGHLMLRAKKSIDWSQYFGLDRKKKASSANEELKKRSDSDSSSNNDDDEEDDSSESDKKKRDFDVQKLESMDKKLQSIEDFIIDETLKYTGAHEGLNSRDDIRRIKDHVLSRLATAYSLEKMRRALDKLRRSVENENHLIHNAIEPESEENALNSNYWQSKKSVKKDQAEEQAEDIKPKDMEKKKRSGYVRYPEQPNNMEEALSLGSGPYETLNDAYLGNKNYIIGSNQCPIIESMAERCRGVDLISGDVNQELLPLCGVHQICYLCGASQVACDYQYLAEADGICGGSNDCQSAARSILMILRGSPGRQLGPRECLKNPCLYRAMREIGL